MLNHNSPSRLGYFIVIALLGIAIAYFCIRVGIYEGDIRAVNIEKNWAEGENKTLKEREKQYIEALTYYQNLVRNARQLQQDSTVNLPKGTIIIPPVEQPGEGL